jgi:hypothetical protein
MANMIPISTVTVGSGGASNIQFTNIPQTYTDLMVKVSAKTTRDSTIVLFTLTVNGSTTMTWRSLVSEGTTAGSYLQSAYGATTNAIGGMPGTVSTTTNTFGIYEVYLPNYASSTAKSFSADTAFEGNISGSYLWTVSGLITASDPITSLSMAPESGYTLSQYSSATLYGIRKY